MSRAQHAAPGALPVPPSLGTDLDGIFVAMAGRVVSRTLLGQLWSLPFVITGLAAVAYDVWRLKRWLRLACDSVSGGTGSTL